MEIKKIIVHCSATKNFVDYTAQDVHNWHQKRGWDGVGYHYLIRIDGTVEKGRPEFWQGAHVVGQNEDSLGIMLFGNDEFTDAQVNALEEQIRDILTRYPKATVHSHWEFDPHKTCPNFDAGDWWQSVKKTVENFQ